jgi:hypothetical protein
MELVNPLAAFRDGYDLQAGMAQDRTQRTAGRALADGDINAAANAFYQGGDVRGGMALNEYAAERGREARAEQSASEERAKKERLAALSGAYRALRGVPEAERREAYRTRVRPVLEGQLGLPPELLEQIDGTDFSDASMDTFGLALGEEE